MKLYATLKNNRGGKKNTADDTRILVELSYKNRVVGEVGLYSITDKGEDLGYRVVWNDPNKGYTPDNVLKEEEKAKTTGEKGVFCKVCNRSYTSEEIDPCDIPF